MARSLSSWSERERALGVVIPTRFRCISYSHRKTLPSTRVSYFLFWSFKASFLYVFSTAIPGTKNFIAFQSLPFLSQPVQSIKVGNLTWITKKKELDITDASFFFIASPDSSQNRPCLNRYSMKQASFTSCTIYSIIPGYPRQALSGPPILA